MRVIKLLIAIFVLLVVSGAIFFVNMLMKKEKGNSEVISLEQYYSIKGEEAKFFIDAEETSWKAFVMEGKPYISYDLAKELVPKLFFEEENEVVILTDATTKSIYTIGADEVLRNGESERLNYIPFRVKGEELLVALEWIDESFSITYFVSEKPYRVLLFLSEKTYTKAKVKEDSFVREAPDLQAKGIINVAEGSEIWVLNKEENVEFDKILTKDGVMGYLLKRSLDAYQSDVVSFQRKSEKEGYQSIQMQEPIVLAWHQIFQDKTNLELPSLLNRTIGVNVISPTWFSIIREDGELSSFASHDYVEEAHKRGVQVWALVNDFDKNVDFYELFMNDTNRESLIDNLLYFVREYNLDGINIDFETIKNEYAEGFVQFLRDFSIAMRKEGKVFSIDNYVPAAHTAFYNRKEQGVLADYVCVMAYDEHYYGSAEAGSVSSLSWVRRGIDLTAEEVPMEKLIIGLPFYTRIWKMKPDGTMETKALGMDGGFKRVKDAGVEPVWDEISGQYYGEWEREQNLYKIWLEEETSIEKKLEEIDISKVAGVAFWKLGLERETVWKKIQEWLQN